MNRIVIENGKTNYHIVTNDMPHEAEMYAASTLYEYLQKASGVMVPYFSDSERCPRRGPEIHIGPNVRGIQTDVNALSDDGFVIKTRGEDIVIAGKTPRGTIYGVYYFLEKYINFKCYTKDVESFEHIEKLSVENLDLCENPAFAYREMYFRSGFDPDFNVKNRMNSNIAHIPKEKGGKIKFYNCHHSFQDLVPSDVYYDTHPEYFSMVNGERVREHPQLCLSNENVFQIARDTLRRWIRENPDCKVFSVAQNDFRNYCTCPECRSLDEKYGTPAASVITFVNRLADDIKEDYSDVLLHTFAYRYTKKAPVGLGVRDNVIVRLCNIECSWNTPMKQQALEQPDSEAAGFIKDLSEWGKMCKNLYIWDYACNFRNYLMPFPNYYSLAKNLQTYYENHVTGVLQQGNFSYGEASGMSDLEIYLGARLLWNPYQDVDPIIDEFIQGVYGKESYPYIREYIDLLLKAMENNELTIYQYTDTGFVTDELVQKADELFQKALNAGGTERNRWYLEKEYLSILFMKTTRMKIGNPQRDELIDQLYEKVKAFGITEIRERRYLDTSFENLKKERYARNHDNEYSLYYIMR